MTQQHGRESKGKTPYLPVATVGKLAAAAKKSKMALHYPPAALARLEVAHG